jgi:phosphoribosylformylglycinamidine (FGAM) synthase-like enzyme
VVGLLEQADRLVRGRFTRAGDVIVLLGEDRGELGGSEYLKLAHGLVRGRPPAIDLETERALQTLLVDLADRCLVGSAHDCSDGGLAVALAECCFDGIGAEISIAPAEVSRDDAMNCAAALFSESASRVVVSTTVESVADVLERAAAAGVPARVVGQTGGNLLRIAVGGQMAIDRPVDEAERAWAGAMSRYFERRVA